MGTHDADSDLDEVRRAAFEIRQRDPSEAARMLRRLVRQGGDAEALAHGALGEILLDDFDDVDGAIHHFKRLLALAPGMAAGELGLARAYARNGERPAAQAAFARALAGLEAIVREAMTGRIEDMAGADEAILTMLELAIEERELCRDSAGKPLTHPSPELLDWAEAVRLFDDPDDPDGAQDWVRFTQGRALIDAFEGHLATALARVDDVRLHLPPGARAQLRSLAFEAAGDLAQAADQALEAIKTPDAAFDPDACLRCAGLLAHVGRSADAQRTLEELRDRVRTAELPDDVREAVAREADARLADLPEGQLVSLGLGKGRLP